LRSGHADFDQDIVNCKRQHLDDRLDVRLVMAASTSGWP
jgi:hypothetical protein